jgi:hypothetical protein
MKKGEAYEQRSIHGSNVDLALTDFGRRHGNQLAWRRSRRLDYSDQPSDSICGIHVRRNQTPNRVAKELRWALKGALHV